MDPLPWKPAIISLTEGPEARARKIDASFFPPVPEETLAAWEGKHDLVIPAELRTFVRQSDGLEAACGQMWPVLPFARWEAIDDACLSGHPWIRFGEGSDHHYLVSLGHSPSIYRYQRFGSDEEFFAPGFHDYLRRVFRGDS